MIAFEISVNGKVLSTIGREDLCRMWIQADVRGKLGKDSVCGFPATARLLSIGSENMDQMTQALHWKQLDFSIGDEVLIRLVETDDADAPLTTDPKVVA